MNDRWDNVTALFEEALERPPETRTAWLADVCNDPALREEVKRMLAAHERTDGILDRPIHGPSTNEPEERSSRHVERKQVGPYRLIEEIGRGGMGVVYKARDPRLERFAALKFLPPLLCANEQAVRRFKTEARAIAAIDHAHICTIYDIGETEAGPEEAPGQLFIAMAYYDGPTLAQKKEQGPLPVEESVEFAVQAAEGLKRAHDARIVHRDVKPSNLILTEHQELKVLDFGIAKLERGADRAQPDDRLGTVAYMAPEQVRGEAVGPHADLWALGVVLYELLTGRHPFGGAQEAALLQTILHDDPPPLREVRPECPDALDDVLRAALAKSPAERYASAVELIEDLEAVRSAGSPSFSSEATKPSPGSLPAPLTSFVGRAREVEAVKEQLSSTRLLTLTGPAGTGKTRLALQVAAAMKEERDAGVHFVSLAPVADPERVASAIAQALGVDEKPTQSITESLIDVLQDRDVLLVLDNFEQVIGAAPLVADLLAACPALRVLVTSREALRLSGEHEFPVPPLERPPSDAASDPDALRQYSAVALFEERAAAVRPQFGITEANARAVANLCRRLGGLPLAIELAAARIKLFSPEEMVERLSRRLDLLKGGPRDRPARHQTLRQAIGWSYDLLDAQEQAFFRRMAVFVDGCTVEAAEAVANACEPLDLDVIDGMAALVDRNLLRRETGADGTSRFVMLEMIRAYGLERLQAEREEAATRQTHAEYFLSLAETAEPNLTGPRQGHWLDRLESEHDNLRAALSWTEETENAEMGLRMGAALWRFWAVRGHLREGSQRLERLLDQPEARARTEARARALNAAGTLLHELSDFDAARSRLEESLAIWREIEDRHGMATALNNLGWVDVQTSTYDRAQRLSEEALSLCRALESKRDIALSLNNLGWVAMLRGAFDDARSLYRESLDLRRELEDERGTAFALTNLGWAEHYRGAYKRAEALLDEAASILQTLNDAQLIAWTYNIQALVAHALGALETAATVASDSVSLWRDVGNKEGLAFALCSLADIRRDKGDLNGARRYADEAVPIIRDIGDQWDLALALRIRGAVARAEGNATRAMALYEKSLTVWADLGARWGVVTCLEAIARMCRVDDAKRAVRIWAAAEAQRDQIHAPRPPNEQNDHERHLELLQADLDEDAFRAAWDEGRAKALDEAIILAREAAD